MYSQSKRLRPLARALTLCALSAGLAAGLACSNDEGGATSSKPAAPAAEAPAKPKTPEEAPAPKPEPKAPAAKKEPTQAELVAEGRSVYMANCIACHSQDPTMDGALGPAVAGSSYELLEARVLRAEYPPGYTPKRDTRVMIALPHLKDQLSALTAYLQSVPN